METNNNKKINLLLAIGVLATFLVQQASFIMLPALNSMSELYSDVPYSKILLLTTIVYLGIVPFSVISGLIAGTKVKYKTLVVGTAIAVLITGIIPFFIRDNFNIILVMRFLQGAAQGLAFPLCNTLVIRLFKGKQRTRLLGISQICLNMSGVVYQMVSGYVCVINTNYIWWVHLLLLIPIILTALFLKEPKDEDDTVVTDDKDAVTLNNSKPRYHIRAVMSTVAFFIWFMPLYSVSLNMSSIVAQLGGSATVAGTIGSINSVFGMIAGIVYASVYGKMRKHTMVVGLVAGFAGIALCGYATNIPMLMVASALVGLATFVVATSISRDFDGIVNPVGVGFALGLLGALWNLSAFFTTPFIAIIEKVAGSANPQMPLRYGMWWMLIVAVVWYIFRLRRPKSQEPQF